MLPSWTLISCFQSWRNEKFYLHLCFTSTLYTQFRSTKWKVLFKDHWLFKGSLSLRECFQKTSMKTYITGDVSHIATMKHLWCIRQWDHVALHLEEVWFVYQLQRSMSRNICQWTNVWLLIPGLTLVFSPLRKYTPHWQPPVSSWLGGFQGCQELCESCLSVCGIIVDTVSVWGKTFQVLSAEW